MGGAKSVKSREERVIWPNNSVGSLSYCFSLLALSGLCVFAAEQVRAQPNQSEQQRPEPFVEVSVLSYNVHGLPAWIAWDDPGVRSVRIGKLLNAYDVVLLQEDFAYHALLAREASHAIIRRGNQARSKIFAFASPLCGTCGSGLTLLAAFSPTVLLDFDRLPFPVCFGWFGAGQDCWASKGILYARLQLPNQAHIDFYSLHLDAGLSDQDRATRRRQLQFVEQWVEAHSAGQSVVLGGDFNLNSQVPEERTLIEEFSANLQLANSQAWSRSFGNRPAVDYILYRSGANVQLELLDAGIAEEFVLNGPVQKAEFEVLPLSDHPALRVRFRVDTSG